MKNTEIITGRFCIKNRLPELVKGKKCLIVTGRSSAKKSGALSDVTSVLDSEGSEYKIYDRITENPLFASCKEAGELGAELGAELVIGIGGGSPLDASKAAAVLAVDPELTAEQLLTPGKIEKALPIIAIPLTAGTGSEANGSSVITVGDKKKSFSSPITIPIAAFLDPRYLKTLNRKYTVSTAVDAFCHCIESYLSPKSTPDSEKDALSGGKAIWEALTTNDFIENGDDAAGLSEDTRLKMMIGAAHGGRAIMTTGTGFTHPLGYGLTLDFGVPHGFACGAFTGKYVEYNMKTELGTEKLTRFAEYIGTTPDIIAAVIPAISDVNISLSEEKINDIASRVAGAKNYKNSPAVISDDEALEILKDIFL